MSSDEKNIEMDVHQGGSGKRRTRAKKFKKAEVHYDSIKSETVDPLPPPLPLPLPKPATKVHPPTPLKVVIAPPKKRPTKVLLVPKSVKLSIAHKRKPISKTFRTKRVHLLIDNSSKTRKRRSTIVLTVDKLSDEQIRSLAIKTKLSTRESVGKTPIALLRQMIKDYQIMKGMVL